MKTDRLDSLEIDQDLLFQNRSWKIQRLGWGIMALLITGALLGLLGGHGLLSSASVGNQGDSLTVHYQRFARVGALITLQLQLRAIAGREGGAPA